jgi:hypothetical protein
MTINNAAQNTGSTMKILVALALGSTEHGVAESPRGLDISFTDDQAKHFTYLLHYTTALPSTDRDRGYFMAAWLAG